MHLAGDGMPCKTNHPQDCNQDSSGNLAILQSCGWSVPQCKLRKHAFLMMMKEQNLATMNTMTAFIEITIMCGAFLLFVPIDLDPYSYSTIAQTAPVHHTFECL